MISGRATGPLFKWFGAKWNASKHYPIPTYDTILEPYAGSAAYALRYAGDRNVVLHDNDPNLIVLWGWLIRDATETSIREIPPKNGQIPQYLPFIDFRSTVTSRRKTSEHHHSREVLYVDSTLFSECRGMV